MSNSKQNIALNEAVLHYAFGMPMPGRSYTSENYRFGFNGQEKNNDISGADGGHLEFKYRIHDARLGRFLSVDPLYASYPWNSTYAFAENRVIQGIDLEGLEFSGAFTWGNDKFWGVAFVSKMDNFNIENNIINIDASDGRGGNQDFNNALIEASNKDPQGIGFLAIFAHGDNRTQSGETRMFADPDLHRGADNVVASGVSEIKQLIEDGKIKFAEGAMIYLGACNAGTCGENYGLGNMTVAQELADATGIPVIAMKNSRVGPDNDSDPTNTGFHTADPNNPNSGFYLFQKGKNETFISKKLDVTNVANEVINRIENAKNTPTEKNKVMPGQSNMAKDL